jgi:hypothetical protein
MARDPGRGRRSWLGRVAWPEQVGAEKKAKAAKAERQQYEGTRLEAREEAHGECG